MNIPTFVGWNAENYFERNKNKKNRTKNSNCRCYSVIFFYHTEGTSEPKKRKYGVKKEKKKVDISYVLKLRNWHPAWIFRTNIETERGRINERKKKEEFPIPSTDVRLKLRKNIRSYSTASIITTRRMLSRATSTFKYVVIVGVFNCMGWKVSTAS